MIRSTPKLSDSEFNALQDLMQRCKIHDRNLPYVYPHLITQQRLFPSNLLYFSEDKLLAFLTIFFFYDKAVEVALLVDPSMRRKKIASALLKAIRPLVESQKITGLVCSSPAELNNPWLQQMGWQYKHREYRMRHELLTQQSTKMPDLDCHQGKESELEAITDIDMACFNKKNPEQVRSALQRLLYDPNYLILVMSLGNIALGKAHLRISDEELMLSDLGIAPKQQGQGYGAELVKYCLNYAVDQGKTSVCLDVEGHNQRAFHLYKKLGFSIENACDFFSIDSAAFFERLN